MTSVGQLVGCCPGKQKVTGSIPGQDTCLGLGFGTGQGTCGRQPVDLSLPLFLFSDSFFKKRKERKGRKKEGMGLCLCS